MPHYFMVLDATDFRERIVPPLAASWRTRSFVPCRELANWLLPTVASYRASCFTGTDEPLLTRVATALPFDRHFWRLLAGEVLLFAAREVPELETAPATLRSLLAHSIEADVPRERYAPIDQAHFGSRDLTFAGAVYRPEHAGLNEAADVRRLADYLAAVTLSEWRVADLTGLPGLADDAERAEELEFAHEWFPALANVYRQAAAQNQVIVCEVL